MILVTGQVQGVTRMTFEPSLIKFKDTSGRTFYRGSDEVVPDAEGKFSVELPDNQTLLGYLGSRWVWICIERSSSGTFRFAFSSDPGHIDYSTVRAQGVGL